VGGLLSFSVDFGSSFPAAFPFADWISQSLKVLVTTTFVILKSSFTKNRVWPSTVKGSPVGAMPKLLPDQLPTSNQWLHTQFESEPDRLQTGGWWKSTTQSGCAATNSATRSAICSLVAYLGFPLEGPHTSINSTLSAKHPAICSRFFWVTPSKYWRTTCSFFFWSGLVRTIWANLRNQLNLFIFGAEDCG